MSPSSESRREKVLLKHP